MSGSLGNRNSINLFKVRIIQSGDKKLTPLSLCQVLIFSTMTKLLDIVEDYLSVFDWKYCRLDGSMSLADRGENVSTIQHHVSP